MTKILLAAFFLLYLVTVLWFTVLCRSVRETPPHFDLFWSYRRWFAGEWFYGFEILGNIAMFGPFGFMLGELLLEGGRPVFKRLAPALILTILFAVLFSGTIEVSQLVFKLGLFEWDDFVSNTIGAMLGFAAYRILRRTGDEWREPVFLMTHMLFAIVCIHVLLFYGGA